MIPEAGRSARWGVLASGATILLGSFGFTASNTVPSSKAGDGRGTITGYAVSSVHYVLNETNPRNIDAVEFTLDSEPTVGSTIKVQADSDGGVWYSCTNSATDVTCDTTVGTQFSVAAADDLRVVIAD